MSAGALMGFQLAATSQGKANARSRDQEIAARFEFVEACFAMAGLNSHLAVVGGNPALGPSDIGQALDDTLPVLSSIADRLEEQADSLRQWNIEATGRSEVILQEIERNWSLVQKLDRGF